MCGGIVTGYDGVDPVCMDGVSARADWDKPRLFTGKSTRSGLSREGDEGWDKRVRSQCEKK